MGVLTHWGIRILEAIFFLGLAGSAIVVLLTAIEDLETLSGSDEPPASPAPQ